MPAKASAPKKNTAAANSKTKKRVGKGDSVECTVCGLAVTVEEVGGIAVSEETTLVCCGAPMKARKATQKAAKTTKPRTGRIPTTLSGEPLMQAAGASGLVPDPKEDVTQQ